MYLWPPALALPDPDPTERPSVIQQASLGQWDARSALLAFFSLRLGPAGVRHSRVGANPDLTNGGVDEVEVTGREVGNGVGVGSDSVDAEFGRVDLQLVHPCSKDFLAYSGCTKEGGRNPDFGERGAVRFRSGTRDFKVKRNGDEEGHGSSETVSDNLDVLDRLDLDGLGCTREGFDEVLQNVAVGAAGDWGSFEEVKNGQKS